MNGGLRPILLPPQLDKLIATRYAREPARIKQDIYGLISGFPALLPKEDVLVTNDGTSNNLLLFEGTIPINYRGAVYNIPVNIWLVREYPVNPPICFVVPTKDMEIKPKHLHVDSAGQCYLPYVSQWRPDSCNLIGLVYNLCLVFGQDPPVYTRPSSPPSFTPNRVQTHPLSHQNLGIQPAVISPIISPLINNSINSTPVYDPSQHQYAAQNQNTNTYINSNGPTTSPKIVHAQYPTSSPVMISNPNVDNSTNSHSPPSSTKSKSSYNSGKPSNKDCVGPLTEQLQLTLESFTKQMKLDIDRYTQQQQNLLHNSNETDNAIHSFESQLKQLDENRQTIQFMMTELDDWLQKSEKMELNVDEVVIPSDPLSIQMFDLVAEDFALEDTLFFLTQALLENKVDLESYLKIHRSLARDQFAKRALAKKVLAMQQRLLQ